MWDIFTEIGQVSLTSIFSIILMFVITRWGGKRQIAQMSPFDYLSAVTVGSIAAEMATNLESWYRPLAAMLIYGAATWLVHRSACQSIALRSLWSGRCLVLMDNGTILKSNLLRAGIDLNEFLGQARIAGYFDPNEIQSALLETNGQISFLPKSGNRAATPNDLQLPCGAVSLWYDLILDGQLMHDNLRACGRSESWLQTQLHMYKIGQQSEVFYAGCDQQGRFFACRAQ